MLKINYSTDLSSKTYQDALSIRKEVFIKEQNVEPDIEIDGEDSCTHVTIYMDGTPAGTARYYPTDDNGVHIQRVAVLKDFRHQGIASILLKDIIDKVTKEDYHYVILGAQDHAQDFYIQLGFKVIGEQYREAGILHHDMELILQE
ncbi:GNAT family N-acetyltransferase [Companilactobacillus nodensis]|uniref:GNAT family N-acetyltransferase n=1 Tax=Companilactobacillus nodensis DSM 19682 = JCM 14932 = NBRC 107160 TaxID=1423775 RepID=A0A0R1KGV6_9LACO|nr:GNAT family N-acetyltransferase [Companilactobacillus nodensis]KRK79202.1 GNAT family N-acetyltransferase [Companilactobacillus nodensis DSM 19682 = JCM 14932 = NBRC 107160]